MIRITAHLATSPERSVSAHGATLASAVQHAAAQLVGLGRTVGKPERIDTHTWRWTWGRGPSRHELIVRESRSGASGESTKALVRLRLGDEDVARLDRLMRAWGLTQSAVVSRLLRENRQGDVE